MVQMIKKIMQWWKDNYDRDLYFYYDTENVLTIGEKEGRYL